MRGNQFTLCNHFQALYRSVIIRMIAVFLLSAAIMLLCGCVRVVNGSADELRMYSWHTERDNGRSLSLTFEEPNAELLIKNGDNTLRLCGLCVVTDDSLTVCDEKSGMNYCFHYTLYGDRVELTRDGGVLTLEKVKSHD